MGRTSIEWANFTFNPWIGCTKVSPGCKFCYAERQNVLYQWNHNGWGPGKPRKRTSEQNWSKPYQWNRQAEAEGNTPSVFCASLADICDPEVPIQWKKDLLVLVSRCRHLKWLFLTKRIHLFNDMIEQATGQKAGQWLTENPHVAVGTSAEDQESANKRIPELLKVDAAMRFVSAEPLLGDIQFTTVDHAWLEKIDWLITGCESGPHARDTDIVDVRSLRNQCLANGVPFFLKQLVIDGQLVKMPVLDGKVWYQFPEWLER